MKQRDLLIGLTLIGGVIVVSGVLRRRDSNGSTAEDVGESLGRGSFDITRGVLTGFYSGVRDSIGDLSSRARSYIDPAGYSSLGGGQGGQVDAVVVLEAGEPVGSVIDKINTTITNVNTTSSSSSVVRVVNPVGTTTDQQIGIGASEEEAKATAETIAGQSLSGGFFSHVSGGVGFASTPTIDYY